jgi:phage N-6-adenine-methyltransferase
MKVHYSSKSIEWETPLELFKELDNEFHFTLDVCATNNNKKCKKYYDSSVDGLKQDWKGVCWMNPPYGRVIGEWMRKAYLSAKNGATVVCLIPSRTDTAWWHDYAMRGNIRFIRGRVKFSGKNSAPFPSAIVIFES